MTILKDILTHNENFVENKSYEQFITSKFPEKRLVVVTCMDTRLTELLPAAMNLHNGDAKIIKSAGAVISHPFGSAMRSILVALYQLNAHEVCVVGHYDCGMSSIDPAAMLDQIKQQVRPETVDTLVHAGIDLKGWLSGFDSVAASVQNSVDMIKRHPLLPPGTPVHGLIIDPGTGKLDVVVDGYSD